MNSRKRTFLITLLMFVSASASAFAANMTAEDTACSGYSELYYEGSTLKLSESCLIRACLKEDGGASFYFKYAKSHKEIMRINLKNYTQGSVEWSNGVTATLAINQTLKIDIDKNGYYDQKIWYEFQKPDVNQACFKIYEIKESSQYKVPSANDLYLLEKMSTNKTSSNQTTANQTSADIASNITNTINNSTNASITNITPSGNASAETPAAENTANKTATQTNESSIESSTEIIDTASANNGKESSESDLSATASPATPINTQRIVVGVSIVVGIIVVILVLYLLYERKRKYDFSVKINEEIGKVDLGKKE